MKKIYEVFHTVIMRNPLSTAWFRTSKDHINAKFCNDGLIRFEKNGETFFALTPEDIRAINVSLNKHEHKFHE